METGGGAVTAAPSSPLVMPIESRSLLRRPLPHVLQQFRRRDLESARESHNRGKTRLTASTLQQGNLSPMKSAGFP